MFDNLVRQNAVNSLISDINGNSLPGAILFSGESSSGKLTAALELYRILSCVSQDDKGAALCNCKSCVKSRSLISENLLLMGPGDCTLEIAASEKAFLSAAAINAPYLTDVRYFFLRSVRKLTLRFSGILLKGEQNLSKIGNIIEDINENLEKIDMPRQLPEFEVLEKICNKVTELACKLENDFLYDSIPVNQIRNMEEWAHIKTEKGKKVVIIENADRMLAGVRNALLKILEEPPADCIFILLTSNKNAIMQTILSRVRTYKFLNRAADVQQYIIKNVFHNDIFKGSIDDYLLTFLPVPPSDIKVQADAFYSKIASRQIPDISSIVKKCGNFTPRQELKLFIKFLMDNNKELMKKQQGAEFCYESLSFFRQCIDNVTLYNQTPAASLEILLRNLSALNIQNGGIMKI